MMVPLSSEAGVSKGALNTPMCTHLPEVYPTDELLFVTWVFGPPNGAGSSRYRYVGQRTYELAVGVKENGQCG